MNRKSKKVTIEGVDIISMELEFCDAADLLPDLVAALGPAGGSFKDGESSMGEALGMLADRFTKGNFTGYLGRLLAATTIIDKESKPAVKVEFLDTREKLNAAFTGRGKLVPVAVKLALEVSFKDFLDGLVLAGLKIPKLSPSADSPTTTTDIG